MRGLLYCEHCRVVLWLDYMDTNECNYMCPVCEKIQVFYSTERQP